MKFSLALRAAGVAAAAGLTLAACGSSSSGGGGGTSPAAASSGSCGSLNGQGSTFQQTLEQQWASAFPSKCDGAKVTYTGVGSTAGIQQFENGNVDYAGSDVVMPAADQTKADQRCNGKAITFPVTAGGVAIIYNLHGVSNLQLDADTIAKIFQGQIKKWNDPAIKATNPGVSLPSTTIASYHRSDGSGTTAVLSGFLSSQAKGVWNLGTNTTLTWPSGAGQAAEGSSGVAAGVKQTDGGITYAEQSYATQNNLPTAKVKNAKGAFTALTTANVSKAIQQGFKITGSGNNLAGTLDFAKEVAYPLSTVSYVIVCDSYSNATTANTLKKFLSYAVGAGQQGVDQLGFAPLPQSLVSKVSQSIASISG
ncbi:MAG TPA: phosphate ABC transporter substrate-binding protein PstS [Mycobacteriales bacterium]|nr:phosphate ABC transporter substrate-binding protein PstS [Mycobacteriales bacterium]